MKIKSWNKEENIANIHNEIHNMIETGTIKEVVTLTLSSSANEINTDFIKRMVTYHFAILIYK